MSKMVDDILQLDEDDDMGELPSVNEMDIAITPADDDAENDTMAHIYEPEDPDDADFKLEGYGDLQADGDDEECAEEEGDDADEGYAETIPGRKRKRVKLSRRNAFRYKNEEDQPLILDEEEEAAACPTKVPSRRVPGTWGRADRRKGESLPAYHKRVSHELDSDDELIIEMRDKGFSDRQIASKLAKDGRVRYDPKSIATRIGRIRFAQASNVDFLLREGYKEWEYEDDRLLLQAFALADIEMSYEIERLRSWRFRKVSEYMRRLNKDALFSEKACRERFYALKNGTARIPVDLDDDPDTRRAELEKFRESRELIRQKEEREKAGKEERERKLKEETKVRNAQKAEETANRRAQKEEEKAQRAMQRAAAAQVRAQRAAENSTAKTRRNAQIKNQNLVGKKQGRFDKPKPPPVTSDPTPMDLDDDDEEAQDSQDPRAKVSLTDLARMSSDRGLETVGKSKAQLLQQLQDADNEWSLNDLKKMCRIKGLKTTGNKAALQYSLATIAAQSCPSYTSGAK